MGALAIIAACAGVAAVWGTWPLAATISTHVYDPRGDGGPMSWILGADVWLTSWILAWDRHALFSHPLALFEANIFEPARLALAFSETLLGALPVYLPVSLVAPDALTAHQTSLVLTFALAFVTSALLVWAWTNSLGAALVAGALFAFSPFRIGNLPSFHIEGNYLLPLLPLFARRTMDDGGRSAGVLLAACLVLQTLHSIYLGYAAFLAVGILIAVRLAARDGTIAGRRVARPVLAAVGACGVASIPYVLVRHAGAIRPPSDALIAVGSATLGRTGSTPALVIAILTLPFWRRGTRVDRRWLVGLAATAVVAHAVALGPSIDVGGFSLPGPYRLLAAVLPGFDAIRVPVRFNAAVSMATAALAGIGLAGARRRLLPNVADGTIAVAGAIAAMAVVWIAVAKALPTLPAALSPQERATVTWLARHPPAPLLEIPFVNAEHGGARQIGVARAMYRSTYHWHRLLDGYSGYYPASYRSVAALVTALPDPTAVTLLTRATGLRRIVVHRAELTRDQRRRWRRASRRSGLAVRAVIGDDVVYETRRDVPHDLVAGLVDPHAAPTTLLGTPRVVVTPAARVAGVAVDGSLPEWIIRGVPFDLPVTVRNESQATWPSLSPSAEHLVGLVYRWEDPAGNPLDGSKFLQPLPWDLRPGERVATSVLVRPPSASGPARLVVGVAQDGPWFQGSIDVGTVTIPPPQ